MHDDLAKPEDAIDDETGEMRDRCRRSDTCRFAPALGGSLKERAEVHERNDASAIRQHFIVLEARHRRRVDGTISRSATCGIAIA